MAMLLTAQSTRADEVKSRAESSVGVEQVIFCLRGGPLNGFQILSRHSLQQLVEGAVKAENKGPIRHVEFERGQEF